jgi:hypothetical protein
MNTARFSRRNTGWALTNVPSLAKSLLSALTRVRSALEMVKLQSRTPIQSVFVPVTITHDVRNDPGTTTSLTIGYTGPKSMITSTFFVIAGAPATRTAVISQEMRPKS